jgi:hypothetical protein
MEKTLDKCSPVFLIGVLIDPVLEGAIAVNDSGMHVFEKQLQIPHHGDLGVGLWVSYLLLVVAAGRDHASQGSIVGTSNSLPHKIELLSSNHVSNFRDVIDMLLILAFQILSSFTCVMLMIRMRRMLRCKKTLSLLSRLC